MWECRSLSLLFLYNGFVCGLILILAFVIIVAVIGQISPPGPPPIVRTFFNISWLIYATCLSTPQWQRDGINKAGHLQTTYCL